jgi:hypothetical protein
MDKSWDWDGLKKDIKKVMDKKSDSAASAEAPT